MNNKLTLDEIKYMVSGYLGVQTLDQYVKKVYLLKDMKDYISEVVRTNEITNFDFEALKDELRDIPLVDKLQDALIILNEMQAPMDIILLIKPMIKDLKRNI